jgi:hypothetical protein
MAVDNFVDKHCEDELSPRQALSSIGHIGLDGSNFFFCFNDLKKKIELSEPASAAEAHEYGLCATLCISQAGRAPFVDCSALF